MKKQVTLEPKFQIGELVYHPSTSTIGLVVGYLYHIKHITYKVLLPLDSPVFDENRCSWFERQLQKID